MDLDLKAPLAAIESHALACGLFERVNFHAPMSVPGAGLSAAVWGQALRPIARESGLNVTSAVALFVFRIYAPLAQEPRDDVDIQIAGALADVMGRLTIDRTLGGTVSDIDLLGRHGTAMGAELGYLKQDSKELRIGTLLVPLLFFNVWEQS